MGQSCTGKSTIAAKMKEYTNAEVFTGKDYLRMAKDESQAWNLFYEKLSSAAYKESSRETIIYLITEHSQLEKIMDIEGSCKVKFTAALDTIKLRFSQRLHGNLPAPVESMLEKQYEEWKSIIGDINVDTTVDSDIEKTVSLICQYNT